MTIPFREELTHLKDQVQTVSAADVINEGLPLESCR